MVVTYHFAAMQVTANVKTLIHTRGQGVPTMTELAYAQEVGMMINRHTPPFHLQRLSIPPTTH